MHSMYFIHQMGDSQDSWIKLYLWFFPGLEYYPILDLLIADVGKEKH